MDIRVRRKAPPEPEPQPQSSRASRDLQKADALGDWDVSLVARFVADSHGVTPEELFHHSRSRAPIATTRQIAMYLTHVLLGRSLTEVGDFYGRDRTTVAHACARIEDMRENGGFDAELDELEDRIWNAVGNRSGGLPCDDGRVAGADNDD
ncbi:MAG: hypothetical protein H6873_07135 [Hyphomicrobiaceae bacterium]|nr:hypothetical protein [Hyphomicrobiaceae bacterium]